MRRKTSILNWVNFHWQLKSTNNIRFHTKCIWILIFWLLPSLSRSVLEFSFCLIFDSHWIQLKMFRFISANSRTAILSNNILLRSTRSFANQQKKVEIHSTENTVRSFILNLRSIRLIFSQKHVQFLSQTLVDWTSKNYSPTKMQQKQ